MGTLNCGVCLCPSQGRAPEASFGVPDARRGGMGVGAEFRVVSFTGRPKTSRLGRDVLRKHLSGFHMPGGGSGKQLPDLTEVVIAMTSFYMYTLSPKHATLNP